MSECLVALTLCEDMTSPCIIAAEEGQWGQISDWGSRAPTHPVHDVTLHHCCWGAVGCSTCDRTLCSLLHKHVRTWCHPTLPSLTTAMTTSWGFFPLNTPLPALRSRSP